MNTLKNITMPLGYQWVISHGLAGFCAFSQLEPWYFLSFDECFWLNERWPDVSEKRLLAFARRQDNDDIACFLCNSDSDAAEVCLVHGWTPSGFEVVQTYNGFWQWYKSIIDDIIEISSCSVDDC